MSKKKATILVLAFEIVIYIFLLVLMPMIEGIFCATCNSREVFASITAPLYFTPGVLGVLLLILILKQKQGVEKDG